ncbi:hypothetical protein Tco_0311910 [Tanacetum coccineum]
MGGSSRDDDEGIIKVKKKKSGGINRGTKKFRPISMKPKTQYRPKVNQPTEEVRPKTAPSVGKKNVLTAGDSLKTTSKTNASTSINGIFYLSNSFEALSVDNPGTEEVNKTSTSGVQEEGQTSTPIVEKINIFDKQLMEGKCVLVNDEGNPLKMVDYSGEHGSENEVEPVDNEMTSFLASKPSGVGYGTNILLEQWRETYGNADYDYDPYNDDMYEGQEIPENIQSICDNMYIKVRGQKKK